MKNCRMRGLGTAVAQANIRSCQDGRHARETPKNVIKEAIIDDDRRHETTEAMFRLRPQWQFSKGARQSASGASQVGNTATIIFSRHFASHADGVISASAYGRRSGRRMTCIDREDILDENTDVISRQHSTPAPGAGMLKC